jgi:hypothetical protein
MVELYDVKRKTTSYTDGINTDTWTVIETRDFEVQPLRIGKGQRDDLVMIEVGGEQYIPSFFGFTHIDCDVTAADYITNDSGTTNYLVLRTYDYEDHKEMDLRDVR